MPDMTNDRADRLKKARISAGYEKASEDARAFGWKEPTYLGHENGSRGIKEDNVKVYAQAFRVRPEWLWGGMGEMKSETPMSAPFFKEFSKVFPKLSTSVHDKMTFVGELDLQVCAGAGAIVEEKDNIPTEAWAFPTELIRSVTTVSSSFLKMLTVKGDSMEPVFYPGQKIMVSTAEIDKTPSPPGIFVVWDGLGLVLKRVEYIPHSNPARVRLSSANTAYTPYEVSLEEAQIQGRVLGKWSWT